MLTASTLRPGYLVSLATSVVGNVRYRKMDLEQDHLTEDGALQARWETERTIADPVEHAEAIKVRSRCRTVVTAVCASSKFGLLCPLDAFDKLSAAVDEARALAEEFNRNARLSQIKIYIMSGRVAPDDVEAVRAINSEVRELMTLMESGLERLDVRTVRDAANRAKALGAMLSKEASERVEMAIRTARSAARRIVKAGEEGVAEIDRAAIERIAASRTAFLDLDGTDEPVAAPVAEARAVEMLPEERIPDVTPTTVTPEFEIEATADHSPLCQCEACEATYGDTVAAPSVPVRQIDLGV